MKKGVSLRSWLPAMIWFVIMCVLFFLPGNDLPSAGWLHIFGLDKAVHIGLFFILIVLFSLPVLKSSLTKRSKLQLIIIFSLFAVFWGITVEFIQDNFVRGRSFDLLDWLADSIGVVAGLYFIKRMRSFLLKEK